MSRRCSQCNVLYLPMPAQPLINAEQPLFMSEDETTSVTYTNRSVTLLSPLCPYRVGSRGRTHFREGGFEYPEGCSSQHRAGWLHLVGRPRAHTARSGLRCKARVIRTRSPAESAACPTRGELTLLQSPAVQLLIEGGKLFVYFPSFRNSSATSDGDLLIVI